MNIILFPSPSKGNFSKKQRFITKSKTFYYPMLLAYTTEILEQTRHNVELIDTATTSPQAIADGIEKLLVDGELRKNLINKGFERVKLFSWRKTAKQILTLYEDLHKKQYAIKH